VISVLKHVAIHVVSAVSGVSLVLDRADADRANARMGVMAELERMNAD
jgi:hypothetical protein